MKNAKLLWELTIANLLMFIRDKSALFWSLFFPFVIIGVFGVLDFTNMGGNDIGLVYDENTKIYAEQIRDIFESTEDYKFHTGDIEEEKNSLENDDRLIVLEFSSNDDGTVTVNAYVGKENEQTGEIITLITEKILSDIALQMQQIEMPFTVNRKIVNTHNLRYIDFVVPGVIALAVMQGALFGVVGAIVVNREKGVLKRIFATPLRRGTYLMSIITSRTVISIVQILILLLFSWVMFDIKIVGSVWQVLLLATFGSLTFLAMGVLMSSFAKTAESARAMVMPVQMLFMFTSGVYFARSVLPQWLYDISAYFPLTYLSDVLRDTMVKGETLASSGIQTGIIGLVIWAIILVGISIWSFKWDDK